MPRVDLPSIKLLAASYTVCIFFPINMGRDSQTATPPQRIQECAASAMRGLMTCPSAKPISKPSRKRNMPCQIKRRWLSVEKAITTPRVLNRLGLIFRNIFGGGSNSTGHLLELISRYAKLIAQKIRLQLHHFTDVFGLHQLSRVFERGLQICLGDREDLFCHIGHWPGGHRNRLAG